MTLSRKRVCWGVVVACILSTTVGLMPDGAVGDPHPQLWETGDILFISGVSFRSKIVRLVNGYSCDYSHVGIVVVEDGVPFVIHADPAAGFVTKERWNIVLARGRASAGAIYRLGSRREDTVATVSRSANELYRRHVAFNDDFDLSTPEKLYCTELVWRVYLDAGIELRESNSIHNKHILPADLLHTGILKLVVHF